MTLRPALLTTALALAAALPVFGQGWNAAPPNAAGQQPAFPQQTRAPALPDRVALARTVVAQGLVHPWALAELPDGGWLVTERPGRLRRIGPDGTVGKPVAGLPAVDRRGQGGLLDVLLAPDFATSRRIWWSYAEPREGGRTGTAVATGVLDPAMTTLGDVRVVFRQQPSWASTMHYGSRLVFDGRGALFVTTGERSLPASRVLAQDVGTHLGKVLRIAPGGGAAAGNPRILGALPEVYAWGFRNVQAAALGPDGALWTVEHGPRGGDEVNRVLPGRNYGWPIITYGEDYSGRPIGKGETARPGMEQPVYYWDPVIAPSGMDFVRGPMFPEWRGDMLIGGLQAAALVRLRLRDGRVVGESRELEGIGRVRDVQVARDGAIWLVTDAENGALIRVSRK